MFQTKLDVFFRSVYSISMAVILDYMPSAAAEVGRRLSEGQVGIFPCDTIYGLCGAATESIAERLYEIKRRPQSKSFITLMTKEQAAASGLLIPEDIMDRWPAPLTAVVASPGGGTAAIRVPSDPFLQLVLPVSGPIFSTSVNFSGEKSLLSFEDIFPVFRDSADFIVNAPGVHAGMASTLVDATRIPYKVLRQGAYVI